jgi:hypothetical protein
MEDLVWHLKKLLSRVIARFKMETKHLTNNLEVMSVADPDAELAACLKDIVTAYSPADAAWIKDSDKMVSGIYAGPTGISYLFLHVSKYNPDLIIEGKTAKEWALEYLTGARPPVKVSSKMCGVLCEELSFCAVSAAVTGDLSYVHRFLGYIPSLLERAGIMDWCYGHAGTLYLCRLMRSWVPEAAELLKEPIDQLIDCILEVRPWIINNTEYLGTGHGDLGIVLQVLLSNPEYAPKLEEKVIYLLDLQMDDGNWPSKPAQYEFKLLVQFCHGAPGFALSLPAIRPYFPNLHERIDKAVEKARECTWEFGLLKKMPNICHGITGNALAFPPGEKRDHFLAYGSEAMMKRGKEEEWWVTSDYGYPYSLGFGPCPGRAWGWIARGRTEKEFICYNDV